MFAYERESPPFVCPTGSRRFEMVRMWSGRIPRYCESAVIDAYLSRHFLMISVASSSGMPVCRFSAAAPPP